MSRARDLSKLGNPSVFSVDNNNNIGINSTSPDAKLDVVGIISATSFHGDGSQLIGIDATSLKDGDGTIRVQANTSGAVVTGVLTATDFDGVDVTSLRETKGGTIRVQANTSGAVVTGVLTATSGSFSGNVSVGGTLTYQDVTNVDSVGMITARKGIQVLADGINVTGIVTATSFYGNFSGDGSGLTFAPKIIAYDPAALSTGISTTTNITFTFDQNIEFAGTGTIEVRETSNSGTIATSFAISGGVAPSGLSISNNQLIINPTEPLNYDTIHYVVLPSAGIANTHGSYYAGSNGYNFRTLTASENFSMQGGDHVFDVNTGTGPTGWHRYHVFTSTGILTTTAPALSAASLDYILAAGGGGGGYTGGGAGGLLRQSTSALGIAAGTYTVTIGAGGAHSPAHNVPENGGSPGEDSTIGTSPTDIILRAYGGGGGGTIHPTSDPIANPGGSGGGVADPSAANTTIAGGTGVSGQGYPGGSQSNVPYNIGSGGGGSGGAGTSGTQPQNAPIIMVAGNGGAGVQNPSFTDLILNGRIPSIPASSFAEIGPGGRFCGGGGGGVTVAPPGNPGTYSGGTGGSGGGGNAAPFAGGASESGFTYTGGGGGGGVYLSNTSTWIDAGDGGPGVFMIRYAIPDPS